MFGFIITYLVIFAMIVFAFFNWDVIETVVMNIGETIEDIRDQPTPGAAFERAGPLLIGGAVASAIIAVLFSI